ncbi:MAG: carbonic anhydrase [Candidatus Eremiobacteraeota bacterium]|nr:carbonic anhydrase [Candidatus Eremiobacteraeota bacterium]
MAASLPRPRPGRRPSPTERFVKTAIDDILENAAEHEAGFGGPSAGIPARHLAIVTCMDARIDSARIFGLEPGDAHVMRNAGGLVSDDVLRSLVLSQRVLQTREVVLMHHTKCGLHGADEAALRADLAADTGEQPAYEFGAFEDLDEAVRAAIRRVREHRFLPHRDRVRGFVYDVETGRLREVIV